MGRKNFHKEKIILIAGPSSSGKTTFSHRLSTHLKALGRTTHPIAVDNFFVNRVWYVSYYYSKKSEQAGVVDTQCEASENDGQDRKDEQDRIDDQDDKKPEQGIPDPGDPQMAPDVQPIACK